MKELLFKAHSYEKTIINTINPAIVGSHEEKSNAYSYYLSQINDIRSAIQASNISKIFIEISDLESSIKKFRESNSNYSENTLISNLLSQINDFNEKYQESLRGYSEESLLQFTFSSVKLFSVFSEFLNWNDLLKNSLQTNEDFDRQKFQEFSIFLSSSNLYSQLLLKITAIQEIYSEICQLIGVSESEFPLRVVKLESGSLWVKVFGHPKVISFLEYICKGSIEFLYRNFTKEGKIEAIPRKVEAIEAIINLNVKLNEIGVDTQPSNELLQKSSVILADQLNNLLLAESKVSINNQIFSIGANLEERYLNESKRSLKGAVDNEND